MAEVGVMFAEQFDAARAALSKGDQPGAAEFLRAAVLVARSSPTLKRELASALLHLGKLSDKLGKSTEAEQLLTEALAISERLFGMQHAALVPLLNELSRLHIAQAHHARAEVALERLLGIVRAKGEELPEVATALAGLALIKRRLGDDAAAETMYRDALRIREKVLAPNHMVTVVTLEQLSETCAARGNVAEALALLKRALPTREAVLGADHATARAARLRIAALELQVITATAAARSGPSAAGGDPNELVFLYKPEPRVRHSVPVPRERAKSPTYTAAVAAASLIASPIQVMPVGEMVVSEPESAHDSIVGRRSGGAHRDSVRADVAHHDVASGDAARGGRRPTAATLSAHVSEGSPKSRTALYAGVGAAVVVVVIAIAGLTLRSSGGGDGDRVATPTSAEARTAPVVDPVAAPVVTTAATTDAPATIDASATSAAARADSARSVSVAPTPTAPTVTARAPETAPSPSPASVPFVRFRPRAVKIAPLAMTNADSILRLSTKRGRESDSDELGAGVAAPTTARFDDTPGSPPKIIGRAIPRFPDALRSVQPQGEVIVRFKVDERGRVDVASMIVVKSDHDLFTTAVRNILPLYRFEPARSRGADAKPVAVWVSLPFQFSARN